MWPNFTHYWQLKEFNLIDYFYCKQHCRRHENRMFRNTRERDNTSRRRVQSNLQSPVAEVHDNGAFSSEPFLHEDRSVARRGVHARSQLLKSYVASGRQVCIHVLGEIQQQRHFLLVFRRGRLGAERERSIAQVIVLDRTVTHTDTQSTDWLINRRPPSQWVTLTFDLAFRSANRWAKD